MKRPWLTNHPLTHPSKTLKQLKVAMYTFLNGLASSVGPVGTGAHHIAFSVFIFFAVFGDAVSMVYAPAVCRAPEVDSLVPCFLLM